MKSYNQFLILNESAQMISKDLALIAKNNDTITKLRLESVEDTKDLKKEIDATMEEMKKDPAMQAGNNQPKSEEYQKIIDELQKRIDKIKASYDDKIRKMEKQNDNIMDHIKSYFLEEYAVHFKSSFNYDTMNNPEKYKDSILHSMESFHKKSAYKGVEIKFDDMLFELFLTELKKTQ